MSRTRRTSRTKGHFIGEFVRLWPYHGTGWYGLKVPRSADRGESVCEVGEVVSFALTGADTERAGMEMEGEEKRGETLRAHASEGLV